MDEDPEEMTDDEKAQMFSAMVENGEVREVGEDDWQDLMPDRSPTLRERAIGVVSVLVMLALILSPFWVYVIEGFEMSIVTFCVVFLLFTTQG